MLIIFRIKIINILHFICILNGINYDFLFLNIFNITEAIIRDASLILVILFEVIFRAEPRIR